MKPTPHDQVWDRFLRSCAPLVVLIVGELRHKAANHNRKDTMQDWHAEKELQIAEWIEREYLKEEKTT